jgi:sulfate adenylyltransferase
VTAEHREALRCAPVPSLPATFRQLSDLYLLGEGGYAPIRGFLNERETRAVCQEMHLTSGEPWSVPILFPIDAETKGDLGRAHRIVVLDGNQPAGSLWIDDIFRIDKELFADSVFRTRDTAHPGVDWLRWAGEYSIAGTVEISSDWTLHIPGGLPISPRETLAHFAAKGWRKVVGFQTRNPMHRAHEFCTKIALEAADGLVIHPLLGETKADDTPVEVRLACYEVLLRKYYAKDRALLAGFPAWMRYAGPREAIFHAQVRKNYGITHFIVGRDHAGIGDYYGPYDAQKIFSEFEPGELGVEPIFFDFVHYCRVCEGMASKKTCPHPLEQHVHLTGKVLRRMLREGRVPPSEFTRPEVAEILIAAAREFS